MRHFSRLTSCGLLALATLGMALSSHPQPPASAPTVAPVPTIAPTPQAPPLASASVLCAPRHRVVQGRTMVPLAWAAQSVGATLERAGRGWKLSYFGHTAELFPGERGARLDSTSVTLPLAPQVLGGTLFVPWAPIAERFGIAWKVMAQRPSAHSSVFLLQFPAAFIEGVRAQPMGDRVRIVLSLSNPTRISQAQNGLETAFRLSAARRPNVPTSFDAHDSLLGRGVLSSANWQARLGFRLNYSAPLRWFTMGFPARLVVDVQRLFEEKSQAAISGGLSMTRVRKGTVHGPLQMFVVRVDPRRGWRMKLAASGQSGTGVLARTRPSALAARHKSPVAVNGGFFAYDGAAVGAVLCDGEWIRLPWKARTGLGFQSDGRARIGSMEARALAIFGDGTSVSLRDLNGWPDWGRVTVLTSRFGKFYRLRAGEMALQIENGIVASKPGSGGVNIPRGGFVLVASTGARPALERVARGTRCYLHIEAPGWEGFRTALGGGPRLISNGRIAVTDRSEEFREDVRVGRGPRTAFGIDRQGRYIILVVDGRQPFYSVGLTLNELAATMQRLGAVDALNLDGGGSTAMAIRSHIVNRPSDGYERPVSNALLVMRE